MQLGITGFSGFIARSLQKTAVSEISCYAIKRDIEADNWRFLLNLDLHDQTILYTSDESNVGICEEEGRKGLTLAISNLKSLLDKEPRKIIYLSSCLVYKKIKNRNVFTEDSIVEDTNWYTRRKLESEKLILSHPSGVVARMSNVYGKDNMSKNIFGDIHKQITSDLLTSINIRSLNPVRDFIYIDDIIQAISLLVLRESKGIYNLGSGVGSSVKDLIRLFALHQSCEIKKINATDEEDNSEIIVNSQKMKNNFSWECQTSISEGIKKIININ